MIVDLKPQHARATLMLVVGVGLVAFGAWGVTRPDLFEGRALPIMALVTGAFFSGVAMTLRMVPMGLDALALEGARVILHERGKTVAIGMGAVDDVLVVDEPLGRGHPLLCLMGRGGGVIELALLRHGHVEPMSQAMREDLEVGDDELPPLPDEAPIRIVDGVLEVVGSERRHALAAVHAVDYVHHLSVLGPGLVIHLQPVEPLETTEMVDPATLMRRIAAGEHLPLVDMSRSAAVSLALHLDRRAAMMRK